MAGAKKKKILIAEDEKAYARALTLKLQHAGYDARSVENGQLALDALAGEKFDLVLLDLVMPGINGFGVLEELKARKENVPVIVLSNLGQADDERRAKELGAKEFLGKANVSLASVIEKVQSFVS